MWLSDTYIKKLKRAGWRVECNESIWQNSPAQYLIFEPDNPQPFVAFEIMCKDGLYGMQFEQDRPFLWHDTIKLFAQCINNLNKNMKV